ncbi:TIM barrel protein [Phycisphaerales bacterium AB-hyl4]|uniref:Xylose isomerase n=1 Tax=Natronomicrosphaera hydrolytica TaxID=3242702 RepID=A0ABV4U599_9BACT
MATDGMGYRFSFGPWNIHEGADPFGPAVRGDTTVVDKLTQYKALGFDGVQLHDDDVVPELDSRSSSQIANTAKEMRDVLDSEGLVAEFVAPRLWEAPEGIDGAFTANDPQVRTWALSRSRQAVDIAEILGTDLIVLWFAREGTYIRESKQAIEAHHLLVQAINAILEYNPSIRVAIEPKPNEPMDHTYIPTIGHALALGSRTCDPSRVGGLIETAHAILAGLDPSDEMAFALAADRLWGVHLNDQNGLKFDQDKSFGSVNLRAAFNQVRVLEQGGYAQTDRFIGVDVKAMRTQRTDTAIQHLVNSRRIFLMLVEKVRSLDEDALKQHVAQRDYEQLEMHILDHLMGSPA